MTETESDETFVERMREWLKPRGPMGAQDLPRLFALATRGAASAARIERLEAENKRLAEWDIAKDDRIPLIQRITEQAARIERLEEALRPFAAKADEISKGHLDGHVSDQDLMYVGVVHLRNARAALGEPEDD